MWDFWLMLTLGTSISAAALFFGFRYLYLYRLIENLPTSKVGHAQQGYLELTGTAEIPETGPVKGPLTGVDCCWYRYSIEKKSGKNWQTLEKGESKAHFLLADQTGVCLVDPVGAQVHTESSSLWRGSQRHPLSSNRGRPPTSVWGQISNTLETQLSFGGSYRYREDRIHGKEQLYAVGYFKTLDDIDLQTRQAQSQRHLLKSWKDDQENLLKRFDSNRDGKIDQREWELAQQAASRQSTLKTRRDTETMIPHILTGTGPGTRPFLISTRPEFELVSHYRIRASIAVIIFFGAGVFCLWMLSRGTIS